MIGKIKNRKSMAFMALRVLGKVSVVTLQVIASLASDEGTQPRYTAGKAQQLHEDGVITGNEFAQHIHGD
ncbi:hypothetical protein SDC14_14615 [Legionella pneumophila serogroup 1]|uniref:Uncharacterized protein n=1 Tax=Legionella moravica TaxID=39962 RepID=A0A378JU05_9GAMM|nr:hypothetical protein [Legionella moravica]OJY19927.1 MAG: hypothetical protein BGO90_08515 [Legionella sp. 40-6]HAT7052173.1 hypothetical protein [Legionella pneumophila]KTD35506.1 hypothetical protein Lmor_0953 [Legionella moravica]STX62094.1 Uncharacterised protein [Legionella moravica]HAT7054425.1 hypothetical protein [Legionella pneumophila]